MKLLQKVFIIFIGTIIPLNIFAVENNYRNNTTGLITKIDFNLSDTVLNDRVVLELDTTKIGEVDSLETDSSSKKKPLFETVVQYNCDDTIVFSLTGQQVFLTKNAFVKYGETELKAYYIELDLENKEAYAYGIQDSTGNYVFTPEFKDGSEEFTCKELKYNFDTGKGLVNEVITEQEGGFVHSQITKKIDDKIFYLRNGKYTTCDHEHPHFYVKMTKAKMIKDDKIVSGPLHLVLEDVPLPIGLPFAMFPFSSSYTSGIIVPSYGEEQRRGFNLRGGGYYWAINDYLDLSVTGDIFSNGSWGTYVQSKYKNRYRYSGTLQTEYHFNKYGDKGLPDYYETTDFAIRWNHSQDAKANPYRTFSASVNVSTTNNERNNSTSIREITNNQKQSSITYSKKWADSPFSLNASLRHSQNSRDTTISLTLPSMSLNMTQIYPFRKKGKSSNLRWYDKVGISYSSKLENRTKSGLKESDLMSSSLQKDWINGYEHSIPITTNFKLAKDLTLSPTLNYRGVLYTRSIRKTFDTDAKNDVRVDTIQGFRYAHNYSTGASLSLSPKIYGMYTFKETSKVAAIRHVMTPTISVSYTPEIGVPRSKYYRTYYDENQKKDVEYSIFEGGIYSTPMGAQESGSINLSLDNNIEAKIRTANDTTGLEDMKKVKILESLKFSTSYDMFADSLNWSTVRMTGRTKIFNKKLDLKFNGTVDPYKLNANKTRKIDEFGPRLTQASIDLGFSLSSKDLNPNTKGGESDDDQPEKWRDPRYVDFDIPWSFSIDYGWTYSKTTNRKNISQNLGINGQFSLTPKWKVSFVSGYDFDANEVTSTQFTITRDLHCWKMSFNAIPFGEFTSYNFMINVDSSILQDLKYEKKQSWQDVRF
ncbi:putative LPS assembly protein LptD [Marinifilum breve]|uniref:putative LPS assembly protein LptD n=1 Tax=Marinifilum breve TaxID=2184082 RepID=UPI0010577B28|nr:putative LPS assembly protein LptD [Marinifilum breve]